jgi:LemA protein
MIVLAIVVAVVVVIGLVVAVSYNRFVQQRQYIDNAWANVETELQRRYDLVPNLVETVKGYAAHERETLDAVIRARSVAQTDHGDPAHQAESENVLVGALKSLFAVSEAYPDLKANQNFLQLQEELTSTEDRIAYARQFYNDSVLNYNNSIQTFPRNTLAGLFNFEKREFFEGAPEETGPVKVQF